MQKRAKDRHSATTCVAVFYFVKYYLYIIKLKSTGHFYIGVTDNLGRRQRHHYLKIKSAIELRWRKEEPEGDNLYIVFSKVICPLVGNWAKLETVIKESYSISVKCTCTTSGAISKKETDLIRRHKNNPLLLNSSLKSTYAANQTAKRIAAIGR